MKRIGIATALGWMALSLATVATAGCESDLRVDDPNQNPGILGPKGILRGVVSYFGPPPCFRDGEVEGQVVLLLFDAANPPPPDGLASTALNFATVPGSKLFANASPPPPNTPGGRGHRDSLCPSLATPPISVATEWSMQQLAAGRFQVRAFYSRQSRWNPLFNYANLPLAGDVAGGSLVDVRAPIPRFATIEVGVPDGATGKLRIPAEGFIREGVGVVLGSALRSNRPYFHIDVGASNAFDVAPTIDRDFATNYLAQRKQLTPEELGTRGYISFPQDHLSTSEANLTCAANKDPACDLFQFAQASFPQIRFRYGFPGNAGNIADPAGADAWIAKAGKPSDPFSKERVRPFYGIDPKEFAADIPTSDNFVLTRVFNANGEPEILRDNDSLEQLAQIAEIFPSVVLSKLVDDGEGGIALPPRSQTDPIVVIQTITLKDWEDGPLKGTGSMKATSQGSVAAGGLTTADGSAPDPNHPLARRDGVVEQDGFTALVRPSVVCIHPQADLRGTLVTPVALDPNPKNPDAVLVSREKILALRANRVKSVQFGCLPPGHYSVNVVYPTGQAWSFPNLSGHCSYSARFAPNEECMTPAFNPATGGVSWLSGIPGEPATKFGPFDPNAGFPLRPLLRSQMLFQTNPDGTLRMEPDINGKPVPVPQVVVIKPSPRCGSYKIESDVRCSTDSECPAPFSGACMASPRGGKACDVNGDGKISTVQVWMNNPANEDITLDDAKLVANGILDPGEDKDLSANKGPGLNDKLDMHTPFACSLSRDKLLALPEPLRSK